MDRDKQIEEMAKDLCKSYAEIFGGYSRTFVLDAKETAKNMVDIGYCKISEVAEDVFKRLYQHIKFDGHTIGVWKNDLIEVAKEYGVSLE